MISLILKLQKNNIYLFEIKSAIKDEKLNAIVSSILNDFQIFYYTFVNNNFINLSEEANIILIYDYHKIEIDVISTIANYISEKQNKLKFNLQIIYCFPNYSYFSFDQLNTDLKVVKKDLKDQAEKQQKDLKDQAEKQQIALKEQAEIFNKEINCLKLKIKELENKLIFQKEIFHK